jgi:hypothetical protein
VSRRGDRLEVEQHAGAGLRVHDAAQARRAAGDRALQFVQGQRFAERGRHLDHLAASSPRRQREPLAEHAVHADHDAIAGRHEVADDCLHARGAGARDRQRQRAFDVPNSPRNPAWTRSSTGVNSGSRWPSNGRD